MEMSIIKSLMNKDFYDAHRGQRCPDELFPKDLRKIKATLDVAMQKYKQDITVEELEGLFITANPSITTAQRTAYRGLFSKLNEVKALNKDIASEILSKLFQQHIGEMVANIGFDYVNGTGTSLEPLRRILDQHRDDFLPETKIEWDSLDVDHIIRMNDLETRWAFNIPTLALRVEGVNAGHLIMIGARSNTGKTSFHANMIAGVNGFASQGAKCIVLCNEEATHRVAARYLCAATGMNEHQIAKDPKETKRRFKGIKENIFMKDVTGKDMHYVESIIKTYKPDVVVLDMGDKFANSNSFTSQHESLKSCAIHCRIIAKEYKCAMFYMSQLSAEAEGKIILNQSMMEGSKTGKASECDLMILISKNPPVEGQNEEDDQRHLNIAKNKLTGWHGYVTCRLDNMLGRYDV
tara:strand:+ start:3511 stop:4734 length:1224 start_codon:yes stop_codon:yes gene_type:complete